MSYSLGFSVVVTVALHVQAEGCNIADKQYGTERGDGSTTTTDGRAAVVVERDQENAPSLTGAVFRAALDAILKK